MILGGKTFTGETKARPTAQATPPWSRSPPRLKSECSSDLKSAFPSGVAAFVMSCVILGLFCGSHDGLGAPQKAQSQEFDSDLNRLIFHLADTKDLEGLRLLITYVESRGRSAEPGLIGIFLSQGFPDPAARQIGDFLLLSKDRNVILTILDMIESVYEGAYQNADTAAIDRLANSDDAEIKYLAQKVRAGIESYRHHNDDRLLKRD